VPQQGTTQTLDSLEPRLMMQAQYRNDNPGLNSLASLWVAHTVGDAPVGVQWAQIRINQGQVDTTPVQQGIYQNVGNDGVSRWTPSLAVDRNGNGTTRL
jgi:hypothetical protein